MIQCKVNGVERAFNGDPEMPLLWYLRDLLQLTGTKYGCGMGLCGACTVHVNGAATRRCVTFMSSAAGRYPVEFSLRRASNASTRSRSCISSSGSVCT